MVARAAWSARGAATLHLELHIRMRDQLYSGYTRWKQWGGDFTTSEPDARYFGAEFAGLDLAGRRLLEIGFGNGSFLAWAKAKGALVSGTEIDVHMLERAR